MVGLNELAVSPTKSDSEMGDLPLVMVLTLPVLLGDRVLKADIEKQTSYIYVKLYVPRPCSSTVA